MGRGLVGWGGVFGEREGEERMRENDWMEENSIGIVPEMKSRYSVMVLKTSQTRS
jgi:hypothetical protein